MDAAVGAAPTRLTIVVPTIEPEPPAAAAAPRAGKAPAAAPEGRQEAKSMLLVRCAT